MAILNKDDGCVVLRIVYAGAPLSGKTESLRSLSGLLYGARRGEEELYSPDHTDGRTLYFDWLNYTGGYFRGYKVNCQLISVPGQKTLKKRRKLLLEMADVVVFVVDSEEGKLDTALSYYQELQPWLVRKDEPSVGVVIQANKRDSLNAIPIPAIYEAFHDNPNLLVLETIAIKDSGIREAFVTGVRIGLERATWLIENDRMATGLPDLSSGDTLLNLMQSQEEAERLEFSQDYEAANALETAAVRQIPEIDLSASQLHQLISEEIKKKESPTAASGTGMDSDGVIPETVTEGYPSSASITAIDKGVEEVALAKAESSVIQASNAGLKASHPGLPNKDVIAGSVFPPITGRIILHKLADEEAAVEQTEEGTWEATIGNQWRLLSRAGDSFQTANDARMHLVNYANQHKKLGSLLSEHRCMAIVESEEPKEWRVWQIVRIEATFDEWLHTVLMGNYPHKIGQEVCNIVDNIFAAHNLFATNDHKLPFNLNNITLIQNKPAFTGFIPHHTDATVTPTVPILDLINQKFKPRISQALQDNPILALGIPYVLHPLEGYGKVYPEKKPAVEVLRRMFIGEH